MNWGRVANWLIGIVFVLLAINAYGLWSVNRLVSVADIVVDGLILVYSVVAGYTSAQKGKG